MAYLEALKSVGGNYQKGKENAIAGLRISQSIVK